jgi:hypothetical protein
MWLRLRVFFLTWVCLCSATQAQDVLRLHAWAEAHPNWKDEKPELAYLASRCAGMFEIIGQQFSANPVHEEQRRSASAYLSHSDIYARIGYFLSIKSGVTELEAVNRQFEFNRDFAQQMQANLRQHNNVMVPPLSLDLEICMMNFRFAELQARQLEAEYSKLTLPKPSVVTPTDKAFDSEALAMVWRFIKSRTGAPMDATMPRLVIQPGLPTNARMVFEFPSQDQPWNALQINVSPRTLQAWSRPMVNWALGHELVHYAFLMRENNWQPQTIYTNMIRHHCNPEFLQLTGDIADLISDTQSPSRERLRMYSEVFRSCTRHPDQ